MRLWLLPVLALLTCLPLSSFPGDAARFAALPPYDIDLPEGFADTVLATGLTGATAMAIAPDGRLFVCEQTGALRVVKNDVLLPKPFVTVAVDSYWERGLIGVALHPDFPKTPYVYVCYVANTPYSHHRISRFTARGDEAAPGSEVILFEGDDQRQLGGSQPAGHQGGAVHFGQDGKLYVGFGEQTNDRAAQRMDTLQGKLLRLNPDGSIPPDNPFFKTAKGKYRATWALGLRNPFAFAVQPGTGRIFINDVGNSRLEEINEGVAGANYGWPVAEGPTTDPKYRNPVHAYARNVGRSITGGSFYNPPVRQFPPRYVGKYFFADYMDNWIRVLDPDDPREATVFATGLAGPVDLCTGPDGSLYYLNRRAWVKDNQFKPHTGSVHRVSYTANAKRPLAHVTLQPEDRTAAPGQSVTFTVAALSTALLKYQWFRDGKPVRGAVSPTYTFAKVSAADDGAQFRCAVSTASGVTRSRRATLRVLPWREAVTPGRALPGLAYQYFEGAWNGLPDFASQKPARTGAVAVPDLGPRKREDRIGFTFRGFLEVSRDGVYTYFLNSDGASQLFLGGARVALTTGTRRGQEASGRVALRAGKHALAIVYTQEAGPPAMRVEYTGPDLPRQPLSADRLFRTDPADGLARREAVATLSVSPDPADLPPLLSQTGVFRSLEALTPNPGVIPYDVISPLWGDGAAKRRWVALPGDARIEFRPTGAWQFPAGAVFIKHFEIGTPPCRLETRLLVMDETGTGYGVTYKWRPDQREADLLADGLTEEIDVPSSAGPCKQKWSYPSRGDCLICHTAPAGFVLGPKAVQLTDNQLRTWNRLGLFKRPLDEASLSRLGKLAALSDKTASLERRARSYLDSNCAHCHRPGGARGLFDARFEVPLARQNLIHGPVAAADLGVRNPELIAPGDPARSMLYQRMIRRQDVFKMPPLATHEVDREAAAVMREWVLSLGKR
jgi:uncharacterized repeat protein (TIGR03806 family)